MKGQYITDHITSIEHLNKAFETLFTGSRFDCSSTGENFYTNGRGIGTENFFLGNFISDKLGVIHAYNLRDCVISMPRLGNFDTTVSNNSVRNKAQTTGNIVSSVEEVIYDNPSQLVNNYAVFINHQDLMNMLGKKYGIQKFDDFIKEIHFTDEKVKALFYYAGTTIHIVDTFTSLRESLVAKMNIKEIAVLMATDIIGDLLHRKSLLNESPDKKIVSKAEEIMESECENVSTIQEIADKVFTSPRNLQKAFKKYREYTPLQFLKERKLHRAHYLLKDSYRSESVKNVAIRVGIFDINRFGKYYYDQFGEYPSETLRKKNA